MNSMTAASITNNTAFQEKYNSLASLFHRWLAEETSDRHPLPLTTLQQACHYSLNSPGKRLRPILTLATAELLELDPTLVRSMTLAIELIHTASLIHDDLPALDNDDFRRGQLTCHKVFGDATAVLAGDALIAWAFEIVARDTILHANQKLEAIIMLTSVIEEICEGQMLDLNVLEIEHVSVSRKIGEHMKSKIKRDDRPHRARQATADWIQACHQKKTGALIATALAIPCIFLTNDTKYEYLQDLTKVGLLFGLAFQITDDIIDDYAGTLSCNERDGKEISSIHCASYVTVYGLETAKALAESAISETLGLLKAFGEKKTWFLQNLCQSVFERK